MPISGEEVENQYCDGHAKDAIDVFRDNQHANGRFLHTESDQ